MATEAERWAAINGVRFWIRTRSDESVPVRGWPIVDDLTDGQLQALRDEDYSDFRVERRHGPDLTYNCHGMTFAWRHGRIDNTPFPVPGYKVLAGNEPPGNTDAEIQKLLHRNGYSCRWETGNVALSHSPPGGPPSIDVGDVVLYINPLLERQGESIMHSGLVIAFAKLGGFIQTMVLSKFGFGGEYVHPYQWTPGNQYGPRVEIWSERGDRDFAKHGS